MTIEGYETRIGEISQRALSQGGEDLLDRVTARMSVASRHVRRVQRGELMLVPAVEREIEDSFAHAEALLTGAMQGDDE